MDNPFFLVDAFTNQPFKGNSAGVCILDAPLADQQLQQIARLVNASETAFVIRSHNQINLRWFSPLVEMKLCGHATLAAAHVLWQENMIDERTPISFSTLSGTLTVTKNADWIAMDFPRFEAVAATAPEELLDILKIEPVQCCEVFDRYLFEVATEQEILDLDPDFGRLKSFPKVLITSKAAAGSRFDFISRYFAPSIGVNEDPVTGTSHSCLAPYWSKKLHKTEFLAYQASKRGGVLKLNLSDTGVRISGQAYTVIKGTFSL